MEPIPRPCTRQCIHGTSVSPRFVPPPPPRMGRCCNENAFLLRSAGGVTYYWLIGRSTVERSEALPFSDAV
jgi:hypothetical protein